MPTAVGGTSSSAAESSEAATKQAAADEKIMTDLEMVDNKIQQCQNLLASRHDMELLLATVGFLEACAPRLVELIEAAAQGALSEHVMVKLLDVNDRLTKLLDDVDHDPLDESSATAIAPASTATEADGGQQEALFTVDDDDDEEEVDLGATLPPAIGKTKSEDEFDSFFNDRLDPK